MLMWRCGHYDPDDFGEAAIVVGLNKLARRRTLRWAAYLKGAKRRSSASTAEAVVQSDPIWLATGRH